MPIARHDPRFFDESDRSTKLLDSAEASVKLWTPANAATRVEPKPAMPKRPVLPRSREVPPPLRKAIAGIASTSGATCTE
jgi:hypothetical protein